MPKLPIKRLPSNDAGRLIVRLHEDYREDVPRYGIAKITNLENSKFERVLMLGHKDSDAIYMPFDIRGKLGAPKGGPLDFSIAPEGRYGKLRWYLQTPDPAVHVPAWIALIALVFSILGLILGGLSLFSGTGCLQP